MKLANHSGRAALVVDDAIADVAEASGGRFGPDPMSVYDDWTTFADFAAGVTAGTAPLVEADLRCPVPAPAPGVRHRPQLPQPRRGVGHGRARACRRRSRSSRRRSSGPFDDVEIVGDHASTGRSSSSSSSARAPTASPKPTRGRTSPASPSARTSATARCSSRPVRSSRSASRAAATGRWDRGSSRSTRCRTRTTSRSAARSTARRCRTPGPATSSSACRSSIAELSAVLPLLPGDVIFTGTPAGVGATRQPPRFLRAGPGPRDVDRGHRHDPEPLRVMARSAASTSTRTSCPTRTARPPKPRAISIPTASHRCPSGMPTATSRSWTASTSRSHCCRSPRPASTSVTMATPAPWPARSTRRAIARSSSIPARFGHLASLPLPDVDGALAEIDYAYDALDVDGVALLTNANGTYLGDTKLDRMFAELDRRHARVFIHPTSPVCWEHTSFGRPRPMLEFLFDTTRAVVNLVLNGTVARHPNIEFIVPHAGATLPLSPTASPRSPRSLGDVDPEADVMRDLARLHYDLAGFPIPRQLDALLAHHDARASALRQRLPVHVRGRCRPSRVPTRRSTAAMSSRWPPRSTTTPAGCSPRSNSEVQGSRSGLPDHFLGRRRSGRSNRW